MDPIITDWFDSLKESHRKARYVTDMEALAAACDIEYFEGGFSLATRDGRIQVRRTAHPKQRRADAAHELVHALGHRQGFEEKIRHYHAVSEELTENMDEHLEEIVDHGMDLLLMPDVLVKEVLEEHGLTAQAVWELSEYGWASLELALRRLVHFKEGIPCAGFLSKGTYVQFAIGNYYHPFYKGQRLPEPHIREESGITLFSVPDSRVVIGFLELPTNGA